MSVASRAGPLLENILVGPKREVIELRLEPIAKRVRAFAAGLAIADSCRVMMLIETARLPVYYFPVEDVRTDLLVASSKVVPSAVKGDAYYYSITVDGRTVDDAAWRYLDPPAGCPDITGFVAFHWKLMDAWFEEDDEVFVHARDPYHRIDVLNSSRQVRGVRTGAGIAATRPVRIAVHAGVAVH